jgi:hypothetical protein
MSRALAPEVAEVLERIAAGLEEHNRRERLAGQDTPEIRAELQALRRPLRKLPLLAYARGCPDLLRLLGRAVKIPGAYWTQVDEGTYEIACPCGETPRISESAPIFCACERAYAQLSGDIVVLFSPIATLPADEDVEADT